MHAKTQRPLPKVARSCAGLRRVPPVYHVQASLENVIGYSLRNPCVIRLPGLQSVAGTHTFGVSQESQLRGSSRSRRMPDTRVLFFIWPPNLLFLRSFSARPWRCWGQAEFLRCLSTFPRRVSCAYVLVSCLSHHLPYLEQ